MRKNISANTPSEKGVWYSRAVMQNIIVSLLYTTFIVLLSFVFFSLVMIGLDQLLGLTNFQSFSFTILGVIFILIGVLLRFWATLHFYREGLKVLSLSPQNKLLTTCPYSFSRNPLYVGIICIAFGTSLFLGSISSLFLSCAIFVGWDLWVKLREEKQLEQKFGGEYREYKQKVPRWLKLNI